MEFEKPVIINEHNKDKIEKALDEVQWRCKTRLIDYNDIINELKSVDEQFSKVCTKKAFENTEVLIDVNGQNFPNSYKFSAKSTQFRAVYSKCKWRLVYLDRDWCRTYSQRWHITLSDTAKECILQAYSKDMNR